MLMISAITFAISDTPRRVADAWIDPVRRRHSISRIVESYVPIGALLLVLGHGFASFGWAALGVLLEFLLYEWILEPLALAPPYWERGPSPGETFERP